MMSMRIERGKIFLEDGDRDQRMEPVGDHQLTDQWHRAARTQEAVASDFYVP